MSDLLHILKDKRVTLGVSGGIAAYKSLDLASKLVRAGCKITVVMTDNATKLVSAKSFEAITSRPVLTSMWSASKEFKIPHIDVRTDSDVIVIAPATANIIGKFASGICDDLLSTTLCSCWAKPTLIAPAMNTQMWTNPLVQRNIELIKDIGVVITGPQEGHLACGEDGVGRMSEPETIVNELCQLLTK